MMAGKKFRVPVVVYIAGPIGFTLIEFVPQASDFLFDHWPGNDSLAWSDAMKRCAEDGAADDASAAFLIALEAAGIGYDRTVEIY
ncbi:DUF982 domain-containing protein [Mesorhizobium sp. WSM4976]|uniref:DUF982 domain-containing protein n=1 Tax=Mesorhizobium sp. WSM4976 TaxID=3038549 RepID=UPI002416AF04|nr:DUF982 domain-containing protein [Mesorhizobium sp. WSM4976]MDG4898674.1 DUF982 domain-containing protein [Mesorhizobium sp. WSM4976]